MSQDQTCCIENASIKQIRLEDHKYGHYQYYEVFRTYYKERNLPENQCDEGKDGTITVRECIERFVDSDLGCHIKWHRNKPRQGEEDCSTEDQGWGFLNILCFFHNTFQPNKGATSDK